MKETFAQYVQILKVAVHQSKPFSFSLLTVRCMPWKDKKADKVIPKSITSQIIDT